MSEAYANPISAALRVLDAYRRRIRQTLVLNRLPTDQIEKVMQHLSVAAGASESSTDPQVWFTSRRPFLRDEQSWMQLCDDLRLSSPVVAAYAFHDPPYAHQARAIRSITERRHTIIATGTGSGKTEAFFLPVMELCLHQQREGVKAIILYPRNALAEDQLERFRTLAGESLRVEQFIGVEDDARRQRNSLLERPPDILVTNVWMLERILTYENYAPLRGVGVLEAVVVDELHVMRGQFGADVAWLIRRLKAACRTAPVFVAASATLHSKGGFLADGGHENDGEAHSALGSFIENLFDIPRDQFEVIFPEYAPYPHIERTLFPEPRWEDLKWLEGRADEDLLASAVFGVPNGTLSVSGGKFAIRESEAQAGAALHRMLDEHAVLQAWMRLLADNGAVTLDELISCVAEQASALYRPLSRSEARQFTEAFLSLVDLDHYLASEEKLQLPFTLVIHLVLRSVRGSLEVRFSDWRYRVGDALSEFDDLCFDVWKTDTRWALAGVFANEHKLAPLSEFGGKPPALTVRLAPFAEVGAEEPNSVRITITTFDSSGAIFSPDPNGRYLIVGPFEPTGRLDGELLDLSEEFSSGDHLLGITHSLLQLDRKLPRVLVFCNTRDEVARTGYVLREGLACLYLLKAVSLACGGHLDSLAQCYGVATQVVCSFPQDRFHDALQRELDLWFATLCSTPPRLYPEHIGVLQPSDVHIASNALEQFLVDVCIDEGCIAWTHILSSLPSLDDREIFEYDVIYRSRPSVITFEKGTQVQSLRTIPLTGTQGSVYEFQLISLAQSDPDPLQVEDKPEGILANIVSRLRHAAEKLAERGVFTRQILPIGATGYALTPDAVTISTEYLRRLEGERFHAVALHDADVPQKIRREYQDMFKSSDRRSPLSVLVATSTLEMGVDIGSLRYVICNGVPPSPASFAQRIGRAGRSQSSRFAFGVVWCDERNRHDMYYFASPSELRMLLSGQVLAPQVDPHNAAVARRHLFATLVQDHTRPHELMNPHEWLAAAVHELQPELIAKFKEMLDIESETATLAQRLRVIGREAKRADAWSNCDLSPHYGIRSDEVRLIAEGDIVQKQQERLLSRRIPEQAVQAWSVGRIVPTPFGFYKVQSPTTIRHTFEAVVGENGIQAVSEYRGFTATREGGFQRRKSRHEIDCITAELLHMPPLTSRQWITWDLVDNGEIRIVNTGGPNRDGTHKGDLTGIWGVRRTLDLLLLRYSRALTGIAGEASLICSVDHALRRYFGVEDMEISLVTLNVGVPHGFQACIFADSTDNNSLGFHRLHSAFGGILRSAFERVSQCRCEQGCFRCLRTFGTMRYAPAASRKDAAEILGSILGQRVWRPRLPAKEPLLAETPQRLVTVRTLPDGFSFSSGNGEWDYEPRGDNFNEGLYRSITKAFDRVPSDATVHLVCDQKGAAELLTGRRKTKTESVHREVLFQMLRRSGRITTD
jgi:ATP-dependent helicase YprA (DUF1998 family)